MEEDTFPTETQNWQDFFKTRLVEMRKLSWLPILVQVRKDNLLENSCIFLANFNYDETITTLRYANRAKSIKNIPKINEDPKDAMLREFQEEIEKLKQIEKG